MICLERSPFIWEMASKQRSNTQSGKDQKSMDLGVQRAKLDIAFVFG